MPKGLLQVIFSLVFVFSLTTFTSTLYGQENSNTEEIEVDNFTEKNSPSIKGENIKAADSSDAEKSGLSSKKMKTVPVWFLVVFLIIGSIFFTIWYRFINVRMFKHSLEVVKGKYDNPDDKWSERPLAAVVPTPDGGDVSKDESINNGYTGGSVVRDKRI